MSARRLILKKMTAKIAFGANLLAEHTLKKIVKKMKLILLFGLSRMKSKEPCIHITSVCSTELFGKWRTVQGQVFSLSLSLCFRMLAAIIMSCAGLDTTCYPSNPSLVWCH
jgi:hypothetical protein